jgi:hypothetical protein
MAEEGFRAVPVIAGASGSRAGRALRLLGATAGALALVIASPGIGHAEQPGGDRAAAHATPRPPVSIPHTTASGRPAVRDAQSKPSPSKPWSLEDALPDNSPAARDRLKETPAAKPQLGRLPLQNGPGTIGFETETKVKSTELPDGRKTPGADTTPHRPPTYLGLSISVPTSNKSIIPSFGSPFGKTSSTCAFARCRHSVVATARSDKALHVPPNGGPFTTLPVKCTAIFLERPKALTPAVFGVSVVTLCGASAADSYCRGMVGGLDGFRTIRGICHHNYRQDLCR